MSRTQRSMATSVVRKPQTYNQYKAILSSVDKMVDAIQDEQIPYLSSPNNLGQWKHIPSAWEDIQWKSKENYLEYKTCKVYNALYAWTSKQGCIGVVHLARSCSLTVKATMQICCRLEQAGKVTQNNLVYATSLGFKF